MTAELTPTQKEMLEVIRAAGDWVDRSTLAKHFKKPRLNVWHDKLLEDLISMGLIEAQQVNHASPIGYKWLYRAK